MKHAFIIVLTLAGLGAWAQTPVPEPDTVDPVQQGDPAVRHLPPRSDYVDDQRKITPEELPEAVQRSAESETAIEDLNEADIYHDRKKDEYIIALEKEGQRVEYRFDERGRRIMKE